MLWPRRTPCQIYWLAERNRWAFPYPNQLVKWSSVVVIFSGWRSICVGLLPNQSLHICWMWCVDKVVGSERST
jgi:hypothetical protein